MEEKKSIRKEIGDNKLEIVLGDITEQKTEAIVNAANKELAPGGGVAGAVHKAAGEKLWEECRKLGGCGTGKAKITKAYDLASSYVIHTVGPVYSGSEEDPKLLADSYKNSLKLASENKIKSVSFPALSTGAFGYPKKEAASIAVEIISNYLASNNLPSRVKMVLYSEEDFEIHKKALGES